MGKTILIFNDIARARGEGNISNAGSRKNGTEKRSTPISKTRCLVAFTRLPIMRENVSPMFITRLFGRGSIWTHCPLGYKTSNPCSTFRIIHYPPWDGPPPENAIVEDGKVVTTPDHTDSCFLTLLTTFNYRGLEVLYPT
jgi:hypothetical protein